MPHTEQTLPPSQRRRTISGPSKALQAGGEPVVSPRRRGVGLGVTGELLQADSA